VQRDLGGRIDVRIATSLQKLLDGLSVIRAALAYLQNLPFKSRLYLRDLLVREVVALLGFSAAGMPTERNHVMT